MTTTEDTMMIDHTEMQIPDDVMEAAKEILSGLRLNHIDAFGGFTFDAANFIARAILAERERCARIAEEYKLVGHPRLSPGSEINAFWSGQEYACDFFAAKIRSVDK